MIDTQSKQRNIQLGHRVQVQDYVGTVKYIGEVDGHKGIWLGIDWDDHTRGKHNGTVEGKLYFTASTPTSGSFLRPEKVSTGITLIESITSRYGHQEDEEEIKFNEAARITMEQSFNAPFLQFVGFEGITTKQSKYTELRILTSRMKNVGHLGDVRQFSSMCPNVEEFDLSKNLLHSWEDVFILASELKHLHLLNLSENKLQMPEDISELKKYKIPQLKTLICGSMALTTTDLEILAQIFPNLETLIAPFNEISHFATASPIEQLFHRLEFLDLQATSISDWSDVMKLKNVPNLKNLCLGNLRLKEIRIDDDPATVFHSLESLNLRYNHIGDMRSLSALNKLKSLTSLFVSSNPLYSMDAHQTVNQIVIAMIGSLKVLNGGNIQDERRGAEIDYMKKFGLEWLAVRKDERAEREFLTVHTRYRELIKLYGELEEGELKVEAKTIKESLIELQLVYEGKQIRKKVPPNMQVQKLVTLCQRLFRLPAAPALVYLSAEQPHMEFDLDETREISLYSVQTGDKIVVKC